MPCKCENIQHGKAGCVIDNTGERGDVCIPCGQRCDKEKVCGNVLIIECTHLKKHELIQKTKHGPNKIYCKCCARYIN